MSESAFEQFSNAHKYADTDNDRDSIHHTLGRGPNQAAPGNHTHPLEFPEHEHPFGQYADKNLMGGPVIGSTYASGGTYTLPISVDVTNKLWSLAGNQLTFNGPYAYRFMMECNIHWNYYSTAAGERRLTLKRIRNGTTDTIKAARYIAPTQITFQQQLNTLLDVYPGDTYYYEIYQTSGGSIGLVNTSFGAFERANVVEFLCLGRIS